MVKDEWWWMSGGGRPTGEAAHAGALGPWQPKPMMAVAGTGNDAEGSTSLVARIGALWHVAIVGSGGDAWVLLPYISARCCRHWRSPEKSSV